MSDSTPDVTQISSSQGQKETTANRNINDARTLFGVEKIIGLTLYYVGGRYGGTHIASGTLTMTASTTNYVVANRSSGALSVSTSSTNWGDDATYSRVALVIMGASTYTSWEDHRDGPLGPFWPSASAPAVVAIMVNAQTGTTYTILSGDSGKLVTFSNTSAVAVTLPQATGSFTAGFFFYAENKNTSAVTITPTTSTINGASTLVLLPGQSVLIVSDGTNYQIALKSPPAAVNAQTGTSYTVLSTDLNKLVTLSNAASIAVTLPQATSAFGSGWYSELRNIGVGAVTITPTTSTINGASTLVLNTGQSVKVWSDGTNYQVTIGAGSNGVTVNAQTGTTYTYLAGDRGKLVTHTNGSAIAGTLPQATTAFGSGWFAWVQNRGAGALTITPTTSTIDGAATLVLATNQGALIVSDGTNYYTERGAQVGGATTQIQFNNAGKLDGDSRMAFDSTNKVAKGNWTAHASAINAQTGTSYTLAATDNGGVVTLSNAGAITLTVPASLGAGFSVILVQIGAGQVTITPSSTTVNAIGAGLKISAQYGAASLVAYAADVFVATGALTA